MRVAKSAYACALMVVLGGCVAHAPIVNLGAFPAAEHEALATSGDSSVSGQLFLRTVGGDVKYGAGSQVVLWPATSYTSRFYAAHIANNRVTPLSQELKKFSRFTQADGEGRFVFKHLPAGKYYVGGEVIWHRPSGLGPLPEGGFVMKEVTVAEGQESSVMVTR